MVMTAMINKPSSGIIYNPPLEPYIEILHRDEDLLVLNKPSGLLSVPGRDPALADSLSRRVQEQFPQALIIHRLDKDTSGVVLMSLNRRAHAKIASQFEQRLTKKLYTAVVWGRMSEPSGRIDLPLAIDQQNKPRHRVDYESGKQAQTDWQRVEQMEETTRLHLSPVTGRTHQLRVHLQAIGHPILGDEFYAQGQALAAAPRLLLHAQSLSFQHPNGQDVTYTIPCPF